MRVHVCSGVQRPEDEAGYPEAGVTGSSEQPGNVVLGATPGSSSRLSGVLCRFPGRHRERGD